MAINIKKRSQLGGVFIFYFTINCSHFNGIAKA